METAAIAPVFQIQLTAVAVADTMGTPIVPQMADPEEAAPRVAVGALVEVERVAKGMREAVDGTMGTEPRVAAVVARPVMAETLMPVL
jgi:hypothetical protein